MSLNVWLPEDLKRSRTEAKQTSSNKMGRIKMGRYKPVGLDGAESRVVRSLRKHCLDESDYVVKSGRKLYLP